MSRASEIVVVISVLVSLGVFYRVLARIAHTLGRMERLLRDKFEPGWDETDEDALMR